MGAKKLKKLVRHELNFNLAMKYLQYTLKEANTLSSELLNTIDFKSGSFFTLLLKNSDLEKINIFRTGGILPQNPILEYGEGPKKARYQVIPTLRDELCNFIMNIIGKADELSCLIDDATIPLKYYYEDDLFRDFGLFYAQEVYFLIKKPSISFDLLLKCLQVSNAFWHSLCVLTKTEFSSVVDKELTIIKIREICLNTKMIILGAYDGEGYIFWEPKGSNFEP